MYEPFSGDPLHHNYSDQLLDHFGLNSDSDSFFVAFEEPNHKAFMSVSERVLEISNSYFSKSVLDSLALYTFWLSGLMGVVKDPSELTPDVKYVIRDFLENIDYHSLSLRLPQSTYSLRSEDLLWQERSSNISERLSDTYFGISTTYVDHFWGNIPAIEFDADEGFKSSGNILGQLFKPSQIYKDFSLCYGVQYYFEAEFDYYFKNGVLPIRLGYNTSDQSQMKLYKENVISLWAFAMTQGIASNIIRDLYKLME